MGQIHVVRVNMPVYYLQTGMFDILIIIIIVVVINYVMRLDDGTGR